MRKDQPLFRLYSPAIASAAAEYLSTLSLKGEPATARGPRQRLLNYAVPPSLLAEIERTRQVPLTFTWSAPRDGIVLERNVVDGQRVMPGDVLFRLADHSVIWAIVDVAERDLAAVAEGQPVTVRVRSYPDKIFSGKGRAGLSASQSGDPHRAGADRASQCRFPAASRHVCRSRDRHRHRQARWSRCRIAPSSTAAAGRS